ncbi:hypothetical protein Tco_0020312 [Tanacetum coccineum]
MIGSLMYVTASRPDIMFSVCACSRFQVTPRKSPLTAVMLEQILTGNPQQEVVNFLAEDSLLGNAKSKPLWPLLQQKPNMLQLQAAVGKCYGFKIKLYHSKTKHIDIRHHFIRDAYEKKLIQVLKIHTNDNVADLLTKAFDVSRFQFLVVSIGMINP